MISNNSKSIPKRHIPLSVTPRGLGNTSDMIETSLQSMINNQLWKGVLTPVHSTITSSLIRKHRILFPSSRDTRSYPRFDPRSPYRVQPRYRQVYLLVLMTLHPSTPSHTLASFVDATVIE
jgi:hypothetical protein